MSRLVKIIDNKYVQIEEYRNPNICFNTNEYNNFEDYCTLRETFDPFEMFYENQELKKQLHEASIEMQEMIEQDIECPSNCSKLKELKKQLEEYDRKLFITKNELDMRQKSIDNKLNQQKEFIEMLEKEILDSKAGSSQQYYAKEHLRLFKEIIGGKDE